MSPEVGHDLCTASLKVCGTSSCHIALVGCRGDRVGLQEERISMYPLLTLSNTYRLLPVQGQQLQDTEGQGCDGGGL